MHPIGPLGAKSFEWAARRSIRHNPDCNEGESFTPESIHKTSRPDKEKYKRFSATEQESRVMETREVIIRHIEGNASLPLGSPFAQGEFRHCVAFRLHFWVRCTRHSGTAMLCGVSAKSFAGSPKVN